MIGILSYKAWLIEPQFAAKMAPIVMRAIERGTYDSFIKQGRDENSKLIQSLYAGLEVEMQFDPRNGIPPHYIATAKNGMKVGIIPMMGPITKNGDACSWGMRDYQNAMSKLSANESVVGTLYHFNNAPGGSHDGTPEISHHIYQSKKPTLGFVDGMAASAHLYMASQTDHIMMNKLTDSEIGSIGSLIIYENIQNMIDKGEWPQTEIIRAPQSVNKALFNYIEPLTETMRAELQAELKDVVKGFISDVKKGRGDRLKDDGLMFTGKMYGTSEAIENGLADSKGSLQDAINKVAELYTSGNKSKSTSAPKEQVNTNMSFKSKFLSLFGKSEKSENTTASEQAPSLADADAKLAEQESTIAALDAEKIAAEARATAAEAKVSELNAQVNTLTSEKTSLEGEKTKLEGEKKELTEKLAAAPAGASTTVIEGDPKKDYTPTSVDAEKKKYSINP